MLNNCTSSDEDERNYCKPAHLLKKRQHPVRGEVCDRLIKKYVIIPTLKGSELPVYLGGKSASPRSMGKVWSN